MVAASLWRTVSLWLLILVHGSSGDRHPSLTCSRSPHPTRCSASAACSDPALSPSDRHSWCTSHGHEERGDERQQNPPVCQTRATKAAVSRTAATTAVASTTSPPLLYDRLRLNTAFNPMTNSSPGLTRSTLQPRKRVPLQHTRIGKRG